jgi:hypothetical protein
MFLGVLEAVIAGAAVLLLIAGFWWTRGGGGVPGGIDDPAFEQLQKYPALGEPLPPPGGEEPVDREHEVE